ncbi:hypothetical protein [Demequina activiva]|uniref:Uncharacterized protein n=1 Tax=Demequina activiva TaxID=1582364 RepID=A0A919Q0I7_9MICO|nr:hypothetical protein [Demequina activiva]GIG53764.1 hypothetical protein Dac01nite_05160 [Demequina activiva]
MAQKEAAPARVKHDVSRRRIIAGAAWATPAIIVGLSAPPAAASVSEPSPNDGTVTIGAGVTQIGSNSGQPIYDIQYRPLSFAGSAGVYPVALEVRASFPASAVASPIVIGNLPGPYGWLISAQTTGSNVDLVFTKDPQVSFQYSIPGLQGWIRAKSPAVSLSTMVVVSGATNAGGTVTGSSVFTF